MLEQVLKSNKTSIIYIVVLLSIALIFNLTSIGFLSVDWRIQLILLSILLIWISIGVAILIRWLFKIYRTV